MLELIQMDTDALALFMYVSTDIKVLTYEIESVTLFIISLLRFAGFDSVAEQVLNFLAIGGCCIAPVRIILVNDIAVVI